jgi:hypothetical protein
MDTAILSLDGNPAAETWKDGCKKLGLGVASFSNGVASDHQLTTFFKSSGEWVFLAGHHLWGSLHPKPPKLDYSFMMYNAPGTATLYFYSGRVRLEVGKGKDVKTQVVRGDNWAEFSLQCKVMLMCGCSIIPDENHPYPNGLADIFALFGPHLLLGLKGSTGWKMFNYLLGGETPGVPKPLADNFFAKLKGETQNVESIRNAWLGAGAAGYHDPKQTKTTTAQEAQVIAVDPDGQQWHLKQGELEKGSKFKI